MLNDFQRIMMGLPQSLFGGAPSVPSSGGNQVGDLTASVVAPTIDQQRQQDAQQIAMEKMGQLGMMLMAAGQKMTPRDRATILAQAPQYMGGVQRDLLNAQQARLVGAQTQKASDELARHDAFKKQVAANPAILSKLGITQEQYDVMGPDAVADALKSRMSQNPMQDAYMANQIRMSNQPKWTVTGTDDFGKSKYDLVAPDGSIVTPPNMRGSQNQSDVFNQLGNATGNEALSILQKSNPSLAAEVGAIARGDQPFPPRMLGTPHGAMLNALVSQVEPTYNAGTFKQRQDVIKDFNKNGGANTAGGQEAFGNVGIKHMGEIYDLAGKLPDHTNWGPLNSTINALDIQKQQRSAKGGDVGSYKLAVMNGFDEIAKALGIGTGEGQAKLQAQLDAAQGPTAIRQVVQQQARLLKDKLDTLQGRWNSEMGIAAGNRKVISPEAEKVLNRILSEEQGQGSVHYDNKGNRLQ